MKKVIRFMQGFGFVMLMIGVLVCDTSLTACAIMVLSGLTIAVGFVAIENQFYFAESEVRKGGRRINGTF